MWYSLSFFILSYLRLPLGLLSSQAAFSVGGVDSKTPPEAARPSPWRLVKMLESCKKQVQHSLSLVLLGLFPERNFPFKYLVPSVSDLPRNFGIFAV